LHERFLDARSPIEELTWVVGPDNQYTAVFDEGSKLVLLTARQEGDVWEHLKA
jgi:hypothetical protein